MQTNTEAVVKLAADVKAKGMLRSGQELAVVSAGRGKTQKVTTLEVQGRGRVGRSSKPTIP